jgi:hypothetical protein
MLLVASICIFFLVFTIPRLRLGGFVTPRVVTFYHRYLNAVFAQSREREGHSKGSYWAGL